MGATDGTDVAGQSSRVTSPGGVFSETQLRVLLRRHLTRAGNAVNLPVTLGVASIVYTLPLSEQDGAYGVTVTPNWSTTVWVTGKTTAQCVVNFGTVAPASATIDVDTFRSL